MKKHRAILILATVFCWTGYATAQTNATPQLLIVSADKMNVFYAGFDNDVSISVHGAAHPQLSATMTNGTLTKSGNGWLARPSGSAIGKECVITVSAQIGEETQTIGSKSFRVKMLSAPIALIAYTGENGVGMKYKGGTPLAKASLLTTTGLVAELEDSHIDVKYTVLGFDMNITDKNGTTVESSKGASFSSRQMDYIKQLASGKTFFLSRIRAKGPDGVERILPPIQVIVN